MLPHVTAGKIWIEMSTDASEIKRLGIVQAAGGETVETCIEGQLPPRRHQ
jgi:hypothetical protein